MEWLQYTFTPFGSWGAIGYTQGDHLILKQSVSLFGLAGLGFLINLVNSLIAKMFIQRRLAREKLIPLFFAILGVLVYGSIRIDRYHSVGRDAIKVAAIGTDSEVSGLPIPDRTIREKNQEILAERTHKAAASGANVVVWTEASTVVLPEEEIDW